MSKPMEVPAPLFGCTMIFVAVAILKDNWESITNFLQKIVFGILIGAMAMVVFGLLSYAGIWLFLSIKEGVQWFFRIDAKVNRLVRKTDSQEAEIDKLRSVNHRKNEDLAYLNRRVSQLSQFTGLKKFEEEREKMKNAIVETTGGKVI